MHTVSDEAARSVATKRAIPVAPKADAFAHKKPGKTIFQTMYDRGDLPLRVNGGVAKFVRWAVKDVAAPNVSSKAPVNFSSAGGPEYEQAKERFLAALDYKVMLPLFFDGLREEREPCRFLAANGLKELLEMGTADRVVPVVPLIILPLRLALNTRDTDTVRRCISAIQQLVAVEGVDPVSGQNVGEALMPYYRHILPIFNLFKSKPSFSRAPGDYSKSIGEVMDDTMGMLAAAGGPHATKEISRLVPLWLPPPAVLQRPGASHHPQRMLR